MKVWRIAIVFWLLAALALGAWYLARQRARVMDHEVHSREVRGGPRPVLTPGRWPLDRLDAVDISAGASTLRFERRGDGWFQVLPFVQPAEGSALRELLTRAVDLRATSRGAVSDNEAAALGLAPPQAKVRLTLGDESITLQLGRRGVGGRAWLRVDDGPALAAEPSLHEAVLEGDLRLLRSWRLFDLAGADPQRITVDRTPADPSRPAQRFEVIKRDGRWMMEAPFRTRVDQGVVTALLGALSRVEHAGFADEQPEDLALFGLERPIASIEVASARAGTLGSGADSAGATATPLRIERVEIGSALAQGGSICARRTDRPPIVLLDQTALAALLPAAEAFADPRPTALRPEDIRSIRIRDPQGALRVQLDRTIDGWFVSRGDDQSKQAAHLPALAMLIERLVESRATELALHPMPQELLLASIELVPTSGSPSVIRVAREGDGGRWALDESDDVLRIFPPSFALPLSAQEFGLVGE